MFNIRQQLSFFADYIESWIRWLVVLITDYLPVKEIRDEKGEPFLYRYHIFAFDNDGPGICIHHFVKSDPERGYHDHPWDNALSFILCGEYHERILNNENKTDYVEYDRNRWSFNYLKGKDVFHRVMIDEGKDAWTLFFFQKRSKLWGMISLSGIYHQMSKAISDADGGWWNYVKKGLGVHEHLEHPGKVVATVDNIIIAKNKVLLIKRGKEPYKGMWAFPGGRIEQKDKDIREAAYRELEEETQLQKKDVNLKFYKTIGNSTRDPRGFCVTNIFYAFLNKIPTNVRAGDDAVNYDWFDIDSLPEMAFDHKEILIDAFSQIKLECILPEN